MIKISASDLNTLKTDPDTGSLLHKILEREKLNKKVYYFLEKLSMRSTNAFEKTIRWVAVLFSQKVKKLKL